MVTTQDTKTLRGGLRVSGEALALVWELEQQDYQVSVTKANALRVAPRSRLTPDQAAAVSRHKHDLIALVRYCDDIEALIRND